MASEEEVGIDEVDARWLDAIELESLTAHPARVRAFGDSTLRWVVHHAQHQRIHFLVDDADAERAREFNVHPQFTHGFVLTARAGRVARELGQVRVEVDLGACSVASISSLENIVEAQLERMVEESSGLRLRPRVVPKPFGILLEPGHPEVAIDDSGVDIKLKLTQTVESFPNPDIDVHVHFTFEVVTVKDPRVAGVTSSHVRPVFSALYVNVKIPWQAWLIPGALIALPVVEANAEEKTRARLRDAVQTFGEQLLDVVPSGRQVHSVRFTPDLNGRVDITHCPPRQPVVA
jgi:hypothetical protein